MRLSAFLRAALPLLALASPALAFAQFQPPTDEELKMTADAKAPGAAAIYLYHEETSDDSTGISALYNRIEVLTEKGKELATISVAFEPGNDKLVSLEGRTIHSDGAITPLTAKPADLLDVKTAEFQVDRLVFTLPAVEVGSILEYRVKFHRDGFLPLPSWQIQCEYLVKKAHFSYQPLSFYNLLVGTHVARGVRAVINKGVVTLDLTDIPPLPDDDWMPPLNNIRWRVEFSYSKFRNSAEFWDDARKSWASFVLEFTKPTGQLKKAVATIVAPEDNDEAKAQKIYAAVMKLENTAFTRQKSQAERKKEKLKDIRKAEDIWKQQAGNDDEIALLYAALARTAGLKVSPLKVVDRNRAMFDSSYLSAGQLDDYIVMLELAGKKVYLDPGQKMCPYGMLHWKHSLATGFQLASEGSTAVIATTPAFLSSHPTVTRDTRLSIDEAGSVNGIVRFVLDGPNALYWRQLQLNNDADEVKKQFSEYTRDSLPEGVQADFDHFLSLEDYPSNLIAIVKISGSLGTVTGKHLVLPAFLFQSRASHPFVTREARSIPVDLHYPWMEEDDATYDLPPGFIVESIPQDAEIPWPDHATLKINSSTENGSISVRRIMTSNVILLDATEYPNLHDFYLKIATADQQQLVLTRSPTAKGN